ncbi:MAG: antibiotic biosynthesis monooxygenase [Proteobacteria bacterium]|nr:antibiotic biosynthesis monooxygenase [Pseudomonadota bacterium]
MIIITGSLHARSADVLPELLALAREHVERSRAEPGCIEHGVAIDAEDPLRLVFFERWVDAAAIQAHFKVPASREFVQRAGTLVDRRPELAIYDATRQPMP